MRILRRLDVAKLHCHKCCDVMVLRSTITITVLLSLKESQRKARGKPKRKAKGMLEEVLACSEGCARFGKTILTPLVEGSSLLRRKGGSKKVLRRGFLEGAFLARARLVWSEALILRRVLRRRS